MNPSSPTEPGIGLQSQFTEYSTSSSTPRDYVGDWAMKRDSWFQARNRNRPSCPIYVRTGLGPLKKCRKAEKALEMESTLKALLSETAQAIASQSTDIQN
ncbi:GL14617 [Drosophila persimilis]|uniref:GL14617 n=1 Tax=Drosophila persimilis TaxID=7234 RepID=B4GVR6_DROPE|nr:GL14617 [Drosophila persimilis]